MRDQSIEASSFREWFEGLPVEQRFGILRDYAMARRSVLWTEAIQQSITQVLGDDTYNFGRHAAVPFSRKDGCTSRFGHMWISITAERSGATIALGYYPETKAWRDLISSPGHVDDEERHAYYEYAVMSTPIEPAALVRILMLARTGFAGRTYSLCGLFGGFDCTVFADSAARLAGLKTPACGANIWSLLPCHRIRTYFRLNKNIAGLRCRVDESAWRNQSQNIKAGLARWASQAANALVGITQSQAA